MNGTNPLTRIREGLGWATENPRLLVLGVSAYGGVVALFAWQMAQHLRYFTSAPWLSILTCLAVVVLGIVTLLHQAQWPWKKKWQQRISGFSSAFFLYDLLLSLLCWGICGIFAVGEQAAAWGTLMAAGISIVLVAIGFLNTGKIRKVTYHIPFSLEKPYRILLLSDIHLGDFVGKAHVSRLVNRVNETDPDLVVIAGDLFDEDAIFRSPAALRQIAGEFRKIRSRDGVVLTLGNHDPEASDPSLQEFLRESGMTLLDNALRTYEPFVLAGISDPARNRRRGASELLGGQIPEKPLIVVEHDPRFQQDAAQAGAALVLSGHTHAGQFFPANLAVRLAVGKRRFYGYHRQGVAHLVVSAGAGVFNLPVRLGSRNEIVELILQDE